MAIHSRNNDIPLYWGQKNIKFHQYQGIPHIKASKSNSLNSKSCLRRTLKVNINTSQKLCRNSSLLGIWCALLSIHRFACPSNSLCHNSFVARTDKSMLKNQSIDGIRMEIQGLRHKGIGS